MIVAAAISELMEYFGVNGLAEARDLFQSMAASDIPDPSSGILGMCSVFLQWVVYDYEWFTGLSCLVVG